MSDGAQHRRVAVVTGGGRGIGRAIAIGLAGAGCDLVIGYRGDEQAAKETAVEAERLGASTALVRGDVASGETSAALSAEALRLGGLDVWVNNAGVSVFAPLASTGLEAARHLMEVNYLGTFAGVVAAAAVMSQRGGGAIVNVASDLGVLAAPMLGAYSASKFAVVGLTQAAALELAAEHITVNAVCPGTVETDMVLAEEAAEATLTGRDLGEVRARLLAAVPVGRWCTGEDVAEVVVFLASRAAAYVTGQAICVNGGSILH